MLEHQLDHLARRAERQNATRQAAERDALIG
jgi:hypothetical protein